MNNIKLTDEQKKDYLENPNECPFCHSGNITASQPEYECLQMWQKVECESCNAQWRDVYKLAFIEDND